MKKKREVICIKRLCLSLMVLVLLSALFGCGGLRTYTLDEILPAPTDDATLLPLIESVTVTRADGASVTVSGPEVETLMMAFGTLTCTRKQTEGVVPAYTLTFAMADPADVRLPLYVTSDTEYTDPCLQYGEYVYSPVNTRFDLQYLDGLFS